MDACCVNVVREKHRHIVKHDVGMISSRYLDNKITWQEGTDDGLYLVICICLGMHGIADQWERDGRMKKFSRARGVNGELANARHGTGGDDECVR
jgi:hypothetical protein